MLLGTIDRLARLVITACCCFIFLPEEGAESHYNQIRLRTMEFGRFQYPPAENNYNPNQNSYYEEIT